MYKNLLIEYANPCDLNDTLTLEFRLRDHSFIHRWIERVQTAQAQYPIDDPARFYGFGTYEKQVEDSISRINNCITTINLYRPVISRVLSDVRDQDTLNYLHHMFEIYHGLLDSQVDLFWTNAPDTVKQALAELNLCVHRCESVARGANPRHVVTWYGLPKDKLLNINDYKLFTDQWDFGTVMLNYVEIGKTLADFATDNDAYINPSAFQPFKHYSADFSVKFWNTDPLQINQNRAKINAYYDARTDFFGPWQTCFANGSIPLADIITPVSLSDLEQRQYVKSVNFN
jgi:hypothetical protein